MNKEDLFSEMFLSNKRNEEWSPEMEDNHKTHQYQPIGKIDSYLLDMVREEKKLKIQRALPKPQSKYHK
jgi:hypothetical protein